jgi:endo-1,4-beta-xylanase
LFFGQAFFLISVIKKWLVNFKQKKVKMMNKKYFNYPKKRLSAVYLILLVFFTANLSAQSIQTDVPALKDVFANDFTIGCLLSYPHVGFPDDPPVPGQGSVVAPEGGNLIKFHMNSMSPGNNMKPQYTIDIAGSATAFNNASPGVERDSVDVHPIVRFNGNLIAQLNWAQRQGFTFRGHTLVWHSQTPGTAFFRTGYTAGGERLSKERMTERMDNYIKEVIRLLHDGWPGLLTAMDVVNEAVNDSGNDRTSESEWYVTFGDITYLMKAFEFTRKWAEFYGETQMKLYYNDYNTHNSNKANGIVRILTPIYQAGYLDGIGMQDHDQLSSPTAAQWIASYNKFDPICTEMAVTELDVNPGNGTPSPTTLNTQANQYAMLIKCFIDRSYYSGRGKIINVSKDGLNDQYAFVANASLWDSQNQCKPAFYAVVNTGINYYALDSVITYADSLNEESYSSESWANFSSALNAAHTAITQNYSNSISAADALANAKENLETAISSLMVVNIDATDDKGIINFFSLGQNYPNPFNPSTRIDFTLPVTGYVSIKVFNILGKEIAVLTDGLNQPGKYTVTFNGSGLAGGIYFYKLEFITSIGAENGGFSETKKFLLLK